MSLLDFYESYVNYPNHDRCTEKCIWVYLFKNPITNFYKIGITNSPKTRLSQLTNQSGIIIENIISLELLPDYDESPESIEKFLHNHFNSKRIIGEWFNLETSDVIEIINLFYSIEGEAIKENESNELLFTPNAD